MPISPNPAPVRQPGARRRLGRPRLLIVGCGDIGRGIVARLQGRFRIFAVTRSVEHLAPLRAAGAVPLLVDLDRDDLERLGQLAPRAIVLAPTSPDGRIDRRSLRLLKVLRPQPHRLVYMSTTGIYGDKQGRQVDETTTPLPVTDRAHRRLDAERRMRASPWRAAVLRVPGIYGPHRLPLERLQRAIPVPLPEEDVVTNHIHAHDLARICIAALFRAAPRRVYNAVDDSELLLGQYIDLVADRAGLPRPPRLSRKELRQAVSAMQYSFMTESRRIGNRRLKSELKVRLQYPTVVEGVGAAFTAR